jgi:hypothetical protein
MGCCAARHPRSAASPGQGPRNMFVRRYPPCGDRSDQVIHCPMVQRDPFSCLGTECLALGAGQGVVDVTLNRDKKKCDRRSGEGSPILSTFRIVHFRIGNRAKVAFAFRWRRDPHGLEFYIANWGADVSFRRAHELHRGVSKGGFEEYFPGECLRDVGLAVLATEMTETL